MRAYVGAPLTPDSILAVAFGRTDPLGMLAYPRAGAESNQVHMSEPEGMSAGVVVLTQYDGAFWDCGTGVFLWYWRWYYRSGTDAAAAVTTTRSGWTAYTVHGTCTGARRWYKPLVAAYAPATPCLVLRLRVVPGLAGHEG
eukprot:2967653-Rhodomonas_salina.2